VTRTPEADLAAAGLKILADPTASLASLMGAVEDAEAHAALSFTAHVGVSAGATVDLLGLFLRRHALLAGVRLQVSQGNFDDPLGDLERFGQAGVEVVVLAPFFDTLEPAFEARAAMMSEAELAAREAEMRGRWRLALRAAAGFRKVLLCGFHRVTASVAGGDRTDAVLARFNQALAQEAEAFANVRILDMSAMVAEVGRSAAFDMRFYLRNTAPYSAALLNVWGRQVASASRAYGARFHKALVLDCDNTLWGGILGEDLADGLRIGPFDYPGNVYWRAQTEFVALQRQGVLLCLCSKNDPEAVDALLDTHPDMVLRSSDVIVKQVNWNDKVGNLRQIAQTLNIGLDSLVFVDDSAFECESVRTQLPEVAVFQVPTNLADYPAVIAQIKDLFLASGEGGEGGDKTQQYRQRAQALEAAATFDNHQDYLASLDLTVTIARDDPSRAARISQLSQKSNQFNLTTLRYTPEDIARLMQDEATTVYSIDVADRFGPAGTTGVVVVRREGQVAVVESLLMSCRVLGRGVEQSLWSTVADDARGQGCVTLQAAYRPTAKNAQVADFYDRLGLSPRGDAESGQAYDVALAAFIPPSTPWIRVLHD
jgi:FkbH-like protein